MQSGPSSAHADAPVRDRAVTRVAALAESVGLSHEAAASMASAEKLFPLRLPARLVDRARAHGLADPVVRQFLPDPRETESVAGFSTDPVGDLAAREAPGLLQKYQGRALLVTTGACPVHCRYCFRRAFPYADETTAGSALDTALAHVRADPSLHEVILSGGDPLSLSDARLQDLCARIAEIPHVQRIRLHTRYPIVEPSRVTSELVHVLAHAGRPLAIVLHANHPDELAPDVAAALQRLRRTGATLLNQSVLLRGINDDADTLARLSEALFAHAVLPYYLHLLDRVVGAAHFEVDEDTARAIHASLAARLPGYLVPRLVREVPGAPAKTPVR